MATTTYAAIRDNYITLIEALTPTYDPSKRFKRMNKAVELAKRAEGQNATHGILRAFEIRRGDGGIEAPVQDSSQYETKDKFMVHVAYPAYPKLYGSDLLDDMEDVIEQDADQLRNMLSSSGNYLSGQNYTNVMSRAIERADDIWMLSLEVELLYYKTQT